MRYIKTYEQIQNELPDCEFAIDIRNADDTDINKAINEFEKYTDYVKINDFIADISMDLDDRMHISEYSLPWAWHIIISNNFGDKKIFYSAVVTRTWGAGVDYMKDIITIDEFLRVGLPGVKDLVNQKREERILKQDSEKYNL